MELNAFRRRFQSEGDGPLIAVKDNMDVAGQPTTHGTRAEVPPAAADCEIVRRLRATGARIAGHTAMPELALWPHATEAPAHGVTRNPWNPERTPGGSSGGAAVAVASRQVDMAVGTDGGGSIRIPAAMCGLVGLKPQRGRVPLEEHWFGLSHAGPITRTVSDAAWLLGVLTGHERFGTIGDPGRLRVAISTKPGLRAPRGSLGNAPDLLRELGHQVVERDPDYGNLLPLFLPRYLAGAYEDAERLGFPELHRSTRGMVRAGKRARRFVDGARAKEEARAAQVNRVFDDIDVLITPTTGAPAPPAGRLEGSGALKLFNAAPRFSAYTVPWNITGQPAMALPAGLDAEGMPRSIQLIGRPDDEQTILALGAQLEGRTLSWDGPRPVQPAHA